MLVAQNFGANDVQGIQTATSQGFILAALFGLPMMGISWCAPHLLAITGQDPEVIRIVTQFFYAASWSMIPGNILFMLEYFLTGIGRTRLVLLMSLIEVPLNVFFFYIFIFGKFGVPACGLAGIGYGFMVAYTLTIALIGSYLYFERSCRQYFRTGRFFKIHSKTFLKFFE